MQHQKSGKLDPWQLTNPQLPQFQLPTPHSSMYLRYKIMIGQNKKCSTRHPVDY